MVRLRRADDPRVPSAGIRLICKFDALRAMQAGAAEMGSCLTDATRESRLRQTVRCNAAPVAVRTDPTQQSSRPFDPVEASKPPCHKGCSEILDQQGGLSRRQGR